MNCITRLPPLDLRQARLKQQENCEESSAEDSAVSKNVGGATDVATGTVVGGKLEGGTQAGNLTPDLQPNSPPSFIRKGGLRPCTIGRYILLDQLDERPLYKCVNIDTQEELHCKIVNNSNRQTLLAHLRVDSNVHINEIVEVLVADKHTYMFFDRSYGDLHSYVRTRRRLKECEALQLFKQVVTAVKHCHENGIILRDLKLRKFVFKDPQKTQLKLETLEEAVMMSDDDDDTLDDKHGCPAYVSPEILMTNGGYSGKAADIWSMGVMLYAMLVGRYPFHDAEHNTLFHKIRCGHYTIPDTVSSKAKCLIRNLLRHNPAERLTVEDILLHPWFRSPAVRVAESRPTQEGHRPDQLVPTGWEWA